MDRWLVLAGLAALIVGAVLSRVVEPGVHVERTMLATNTPALRLFPAESLGPHPIALLAHGATGSKENFFHFAEALAAAGFDCYSIDQAGHGESPQRGAFLQVESKWRWAKNIALKPRELEQALGGVDLFVGHSMGAGAGNWSVAEDGFRPKLFIALGAAVDLGEDGPPLVLLSGRFDEFVSVARLRARTNAQVIISPWSDHLLEPFDRILVHAAATAACAALGKPAPAPTTAWRWRLTGLVLGITGALVLMFRLPELHPRLSRARRFIVPAILVITLLLTMGTWVGVTPQARRVPRQLALLVIFGLLLGIFRRLKRPRWNLTVLSAMLALVSFGLLKIYPLQMFLFAMLMNTFAVSALLLLASAAVGWIAQRGGSRQDGDLATAIFASYVIGQFMPLMY